MPTANSKIAWPQAGHKACHTCMSWITYVAIFGISNDIHDKLFLPASTVALVLPHNVFASDEDLDAKCQMANCNMLILCLRWITYEDTLCPARWGLLISTTLHIAPHHLPGCHCAAVAPPFGRSQSYYLVQRSVLECSNLNTSADWLASCAVAGMQGKWAWDCLRWWVSGRRFTMGRV